jgi:hypothetical protein
LDSLGSARKRLGKAYPFEPLGRPAYDDTVPVGRLIYAELQRLACDHLVRLDHTPPVQRFPALRGNLSTYPRNFSVFEGVDTVKRTLAVLSWHKRPPVRPVRFHFVGIENEYR